MERRSAHARAAPPHRCRLGCAVDARRRSGERRLDRRRPLSDAYELDAVSFRYRDIVALDGVTLALPRGTRTVLLGANGSGKSTLLMLLAALYFAERGSVRFDGAALTEEALQDRPFAYEFRRRVGIVFQNPEVQLFNATVFDEVAFAPLQLGWPAGEIRAKAAATLAALGLEPLAERPTHRLSLGEKKRVALASVLVIDPEVVLLDEPTAGLDPRSQSGVIDLLVSWIGSAKTVVTSTHDLGLIDDIADRCVVFDAGRVVATASPHEIVHDEELLRGTGLLHAHRHAHAGGVTHVHPHVHGHDPHGDR